jgi:outer membrane cobalamin receptor
MNHTATFRKKSLASAVTTASVLLLHSGVGLAQEGLLEEVLVTASAREQRIEDIPYNISAMSGMEMDAQQITGQSELLRSISGVSIPKCSSDGSNLRG